MFAQETSQQPSPQAVECTRDTVKMLDDIYKTAVVLITDKLVLRAMTPVPVVLEKCTMCHENYKNLPASQAIGAISYSVPIK